MSAHPPNNTRRQRRGQKSDREARPRVRKVLLVRDNISVTREDLQDLLDCCPICEFSVFTTRAGQRFSTSCQNPARKVVSCSNSKNEWYEMRTCSRHSKEVRRAMSAELGCSAVEEDVFNSAAVQRAMDQLGVTEQTVGRSSYSPTDAQLSLSADPWWQDGLDPTASRRERRPPPVRRWH